MESLGGKASTFSADVNKRDNVYAVIKYTEQEFGGFDVMVNNAGIASFPPKAVIA